MSSAKSGFATIAQSFFCSGEFSCDVSSEVGFATIAQGFCYNVSGEVSGEICVFFFCFMTEPFYCTIAVSFATFAIMKAKARLKIANLIGGFDPLGDAQYGPITNRAVRLVLYGCTITYIRT
jgi:hypothetical protein